MTVRDCNHQVILPCNVIVHIVDEGRSVVSVMNALAAMEFTCNPVLRPVAKQATEKSKRALARLPLHTAAPAYQHTR